MKKVRNISNTGSKNYVWLLVRKIHGSASETQMLLVEALWVLRYVTGCHTLSTAIRKAKPNISYGGTSRYTFATSFIGNKPEKKTMDCTKKLLKIFMTNYNLSTPWKKSRRLGFEKKKWRLKNWQKFLKISTHLGNKKPGSHPDRVPIRYDIISAR